MNSLSLALIAAVTLNTAASQALLKRGVAGVSIPGDAQETLRLLVHCAASPFVWSSLALQVLGYGIWILVLSRERLAVAAAVSGSFFYLLTACIGWIIFNERLSYPQLTGLALITVGVVLMAQA